MTIPGDELRRILADLAAGEIDFEEASRQAPLAGQAGLPPIQSGGGYTCSTCLYFHRTPGGKAGECWAPGKPPHVEHPDSVQCGDCVQRDPRAEALPVQTGRNGSRMFK